jgi:hypothetical protein
VVAEIMFNAWICNYVSFFGCLCFRYYGKGYYGNSSQNRRVFRGRWFSECIAPDGKIIATEIKYNARGLVEKTSLPYFADSSGNPLETLRWTYFEYDSLGRVSKVTNPDYTTLQKFYLRGRTTESLSLGT